MPSDAVLIEPVGMGGSGNRPVSNLHQNSRLLVSSVFEACEKAKMWFLLLALNSFSQSQEVLGPIRVIGRGIQNSETREVLLLACVGPALVGETEASCEKLRFVYSAPAESARWAGPAFEISNVDDAKKELKKYIKTHGKESLVLSDGRIGEELFPFTRNMFNQAGYDKFAGFLGTIGFFYIVGILQASMPIGWAITTGFGVGVSLTAFPYFIDLLTLPARSITKSLISSHFVESLKSIDELSNREVLFWQERAKPVSHRSFRTLFAALFNDDNLVSGEISHSCRISLDVVPDPSWNTEANHRLFTDQKTYWRNSSNKSDYSYSYIAKRQAGEDFIRRYSIPAIKNWKRPGDAETTEGVNRYTMQIIRAQVRKKLYLATEESGFDFKLFVEPTIKKIKKNGYVKSFCFSSYFLNSNNERFDEKQNCDSVPSILAAKFVNRLPTCKELRSIK